MFPLEFFSLIRFHRREALFLSVPFHVICLCSEEKKRLAWLLLLPLICLNRCIIINSNSRDKQKKKTSPDESEIMQPRKSQLVLDDKVFELDPHVLIKQAIEGNYEGAEFDYDAITKEEEDRILEQLAHDAVTLHIKHETETMLAQREREDCTSNMNFF